MSKIDKNSIAITREQHAKIKGVIERGDYASTSEVIRTALRDWELKEELRCFEGERAVHCAVDGKFVALGCDPQSAVHAPRFVRPDLRSFRTAPISFSIASCKMTWRSCGSCMPPAISTISFEKSQEAAQSTKAERRAPSRRDT
jgi:hypothetical protein